MTFKSFMKLYARNVRDTVYVLENWPFPRFFLFTFATGIAALVYIALFPLSLTIGAMFKTIIDVFTRKPMEAEQIEEQKETINTMEAQEINNIADSITKYSAVSYSGLQLKSQLAQLPELEDAEYSKGHESKKYALALDQLGENAEEKYTVGYINKLDLDEDHAQQLAEYDAQNKFHLDDIKQLKQKEAIKEFLSDDTNNGTKTMQIIFGLFSVDKKEQEASPTDPADVPFKSLN